MAHWQIFRTMMLWIHYALAAQVALVHANTMRSPAMEKLHGGMPLVHHFLFERGLGPNFLGDELRAENTATISELPLGSDSIVSPTGPATLNIQSTAPMITELPPGLLTLSPPDSLPTTTEEVNPQKPGPSITDLPPTSVPSVIDNSPLSLPPLLPAPADGASQNVTSQVPTSTISPMTLPTVSCASGPFVAGSM